MAYCYTLCKSVALKNSQKFSEVHLKKHSNLLIYKEMLIG